MLCANKLVSLSNFLFEIANMMLVTSGPELNLAVWFLSYWINFPSKLLLLIVTQINKTYWKTFIGSQTDIWKIDHTCVIYIPTIQLVTTCFSNTCILCTILFTKGYFPQSYDWHLDQKREEALVVQLRKLLFLSLLWKHLSFMCIFFFSLTSFILSVVLRFNLAIFIIFSFLVRNYRVFLLENNKKHWETWQAFVQ